MANTTNFSIEKRNVGGARNSWGGIANVATDKIDELLSLAIPIGTIQMFPMSTAPTQTLNGGTWLVCDGSALIQANYVDLFSLIGITYGNGGNASTHFNLPDFQARVPVGYNVATIGSGVNVRSIREIATTTGGTEGHILTDPQIPIHSHPITDPGHLHPIDPTIKHSHVGDQTGGKTGSKALTINDPEHSHTLENIHHDWAPFENEYHLGIENANEPTITKPVTTEPTGITIDDHDHTLTTDDSGTDATTGLTGITTTQYNPVRITSTDDTIEGDASHNNMQPYITIQYIILAKHPSF